MLARNNYQTNPLFSLIGSPLLILLVFHILAQQDLHHEYLPVGLLFFIENISTGLTCLQEPQYEETPRITPFAFRSIFWCIKRCSALFSKTKRLSCPLFSLFPSMW